uniref:Neur_chan_LBD domain-containing protein n=1 Tax=Haemonchus placei TaxID=6290 RepID=A0A0N4W697_HAEPC
LLKNYSALVRPARNPNKVSNVSMKIFLQQLLNVDEQNQLIEVNAWLKYTWNDYRLRWRPIVHDNISSLRFPTDEQQIWLPDILLYNRCSNFSANEDFDSSCRSNLVVYSTGEINWIPPGIFKISCKMDITMFPFDEQTCSLKFGSWTYHGFALDLLIDTSNKEPPIDTSTYIANGEWDLIGTSAKREVSFYKCCPEPYPTLNFHLYLKRKSFYHIFNIIVPSMLISGMTLLGFCLPPHDMSEKIGFQTTILLSVCFFLTILSEMTPTTSESIPLLGVFFSSVTLIVAMSTTFTVCVLNLRYRQYANHKFPPMIRFIFLQFIPWIMLMKRPGYRFSCAKALDEQKLEESTSLMQTTLEQLPGEKLELTRKVGEVRHRLLLIFERCLHVDQVVTKLR